MSGASPIRIIDVVRRPSLLLCIHAKSGQSHPCRKTSSNPTARDIWHVRSLKQSAKLPHIKVCSAQWLAFRLSYIYQWWSQSTLRPMQLDLLAQRKLRPQQVSYATSAPHLLNSSACRKSAAAASCMRGLLGRASRVISLHAKV